MSQSESGYRHPKLEFANSSHAYVTGLVAAALLENDAFSVDLNSDQPVIRVRFGHARYKLTVTELP